MTGAGGIYWILTKKFDSEQGGGVRTEIRVEEKHSPLRRPLAGRLAERKKIGLVIQEEWSLMTWREYDCTSCQLVLKAGGKWGRGERQKSRQGTYSRQILTV